MAKKRNIKNRKTRLSLYEQDTFGIPLHDPVERIMYCIGDKLTVKKVENIIKRKNEILQKQTYSSILITYYEYPAGSERPRSRSMGSFISNYVPNANDNKKYLEKLLSRMSKDISIIHTPIYIKCRSYHKMPTNIPVEEQVLFEAGIMAPVVEPDFDNMIKTYTDMMIERLILDDDLIYKAHIEKFYSFLPRVELEIYYEDKFASRYIQKRIQGRKSYQRLCKHMEVAVLL